VAVVVEAADRLIQLVAVVVEAVVVALKNIS
jgi:hypothetical protein